MYPAIVTSDGSVTWLTKRIYMSSCPMDVADFPWDAQKCNLSFQSWTYDMRDIDLLNRSSSADTDVFSPNGMWVLDGVPATQEIRYFACCEKPFSIVHFTILIHRKPLYYMVNLVLPCAFITLVGIMVFCLPLDSGEKVSLSVTVLLSATVFMLLLSEALPTQSEVVPQAGSSNIFSVNVARTVNRNRLS